MQLDELKKSMSTLEQMLAKTNTDIKIDVSASQTAQTKILRKFRQGFVSCLILAVVFACMAIANVNPQSFPLYLKIYISALLVIGAVWYIFMYCKLNRIDIAAISPTQLFAKTATIKLMVIISEFFFIICLVVLFTLLFPTAWAYNRIGFWAMVATLLFALVYGIVHLWPQYIKLFRDLNSIKE